MSEPDAEARLTPPAPRLIEINWFWRRSWSFLVTLVLLGLVGWLIHTLGRAGLSDAQAGAVQGVAFASLGLIAFVGLIYVGGATAYELSQLAAAARGDRDLFRGRS